MPEGLTAQLELAGIAATRLVRGATAGVVVRRDGTLDALPGVPDDPLLRSGSPALAAARAVLRDGHVYTSFLWPLGGRRAPLGHARVTALGGGDVRAALSGSVVLSPGGDLRGLTPRELEVLGLLVEGCSNAEMSRRLTVAQRTVAAHLEHILAKLSATTRTLAAVRAEHDGLYVPLCASLPGPPAHRAA